MIPMSKLKIFKDEYEIFSLYAFIEHDESRLFFNGISVEPVSVARGTAPPRLTVFDKKTAQILIDQLWDAGLRPGSSQQAHGQFAAASRHLEDMRAIAFFKLNIERPS
jgi:hypothetical protein